MKKERTIKLTTIQRIGLENLLGEQRGKREDNRAYYNIRQKVKLAIEERRGVMLPLPDGRFTFDDAAAARMAPVAVTFTEDEIRRLIKLGDTIEMAVGIMDWFEPLLQELEAKEVDRVTEMPA